LIPISGSGNMSMFVYATGSRTKHPAVEVYRNPQIVLLKPNGEGYLRIPSSTIRTGPGTMTVKYSSNPSKNLIRDANFTRGLWSSPFNANEYIPRTMEQAGLQVRPLNDGGVSLWARTEGVGEAQTITGISGQTVQLSLDARSVSGSPPTVAIVSPAGQTLWSNTFNAIPHQWQHISATIHIPSRTDSVSLILYAYGNGSLTDDQYRNISLTDWPGGTAYITWVGGKVPVDLQVHARRVTATDFQVEIPPRTRILTVANSYGSGWAILRNGAVMNWKHVAVDGWLNGWLVPKGTRGRVQVVYLPEAYYHRWEEGAAVAILLLAFWLAFSARRIFFASRVHG
jgi:hypothetical protein